MSDVFPLLCNVCLSLELQAERAELRIKVFLELVGNGVKEFCMEAVVYITLSEKEES